MGQAINLKFDFRNIRFRTWIYFTTLTLGVLVMLWLFQIVLLGSSFRNMKISQVELVADTIEEGLSNNVFGRQIQISAVQNQVCGLVYNNHEKLLYQVDALGMGCVFNETAIGLTQRVNEYILDLDAAEAKDFALTVTNNVIQQDMLVYGRKVSIPFGDYYIFLNSPLLPLDSTIDILKEQFIYVTLLVFILFSIVSLLISQRISRPIEQMKKSALKLAEGDYDVKFEQGEFTEITDLANTLNRSTTELKKMDDLRKDLIANVTHDIKTPLTMIKAYAEMIKDISGDNKLKREEHLNVILDEVDHLDHLAQDLTQLTQLQSNVIGLKIERFNITELIHQALRLVDAMIIDQGIEVEVYAPEHVFTLGDAQRILQVLLNFITNAIKYIGADKKLIVQVLTEAQHVRVEVIDHGVGISDEDQPYIWDRYYKIDKHHHRNLSGTGLGLSIASAILKNHHVRYGVVSVLKKGSTFWFDLPYAVKPDHVL